MTAKGFRFTALLTLLLSAWAFAPRPSTAQPKDSSAIITRTAVVLAPPQTPPANPAGDSVTRPGADPAIPGLPSDIAELIHQGQFTKAIGRLETLRKESAKPGSPLAPHAIDWQIAKLHRYMDDFDTTRAELLRSLHRSIRNFREPELDQWIKDGFVDHMKIDGEERFAGTTVSNLFFLSPELRARKTSPSGHALEQFIAKMVKNLEFLQAGSNGMLAPKRFHVSMTLSTKVPADRNGQTLRCWIPFVRQYPFIKNIKILGISSGAKIIAPPDAPQRTVFFEKTVHGDSVTTFGIVYEFTAYARVNHIDPAKVKPLNPDNPIAREYTRQEAHVQFTPQMRALYDKIVGNETNPARIARKIYEWIAHNVRYSYAREYSTLDNIGYYCAAREAGDCGQEALLFITLCRMGSVPARWQSAWTCYPDWRGMHDWTEIYLDPYGWVPVDPYMGIWATRYMDSLTPQQKRQVRNFYFGSMDAHRLPANAAHSAKFDPPKKGFRSDDVDNQRGEMEWADGTDIYFGQYHYRMRIREVPLPAATSATTKPPEAAKEKSAPAKPAENKTQAKKTEPPKPATKK